MYLHVFLNSQIKYCYGFTGAVSRASEVSDWLLAPSMRYWAKSSGFLGAPKTSQDLEAPQRSQDALRPVRIRFLFYKMSFFKGLSKDFKDL